ncbi:ABC transporter ATP-binding protein [Aliamphritea hakodatensis]|uniref:ABC transporter ATP-binding protein n=1 Tax=Aliamphritea hakodatensis TaxID=2895352 RepID=UPI0022FD8F51|nr:ABC transporter ATP-binding protein [Aliamphritea hakodatensis]
MFELNAIRVHRNGRNILDIDSLQLDTDSFTLLLGHNGSGKSTLLNLLARQTTPDEGTVQFNGVPLSSLKQRQLAREIAYLPQHLPEAPGLTVKELVRLGRFPWRGLLGRYTPKDTQTINHAIEQTGVTGFADTLVDQLSGGERQRAWIAMLLAQESPLLILDEPTAALDLAHQYELLSMLKNLHVQHNRGVILVLHDINLALRFASQVIALKEGYPAFQGDIAQFADQQSLSDLFNIHLELLERDNHKVAIVC